MGRLRCRRVVVAVTVYGRLAFAGYVVSSRSNLDWPAHVFTGLLLAVRLE